MLNLQAAILAMLTGVLPMVPIIMGLVQWVKNTLGTSDERILNLTAMVFGLIGGCGFMLAVQVPVDYTGWFLLVMYGIILGLTASGIFKVGQQLTSPSVVTARAVTSIAATVQQQTQTQGYPLAANSEVNVPGMESAQGGLVGSTRPSLAKAYMPPSTPPAGHAPQQ